MKKFALPELQQMVHLLLKLHLLFKVPQHDNINMNQDSSINSIKKAQNITQAITNTEVSSISKENTKNKSDIENEGNTICRKSAEQDQPNKNPKSKRDSVIILEDNMIKHTNGWEIAKKLK